MDHRIEYETQLKILWYELVCELVHFHYMSQVSH